MADCTASQLLVWTGVTCCDQNVFCSRAGQGRTNDHSDLCINVVRTHLMLKHFSGCKGITKSPRQVSILLRSAWFRSLQEADSAWSLHAFGDLRLWVTDWFGFYTLIAQKDFSCIDLTRASSSHQLDQLKPADNAVLFVTPSTPYICKENTK